MTQQKPAWLVRLYEERGKAKVVVERWPETRKRTPYGSSWLEEYNGHSDVLHCEVQASDEAEAIAEAHAEAKRREEDE